MDTAGIVIFILMFGGIAYWMLRPRKGPVRVCTVCHHKGPARSHTKGSTGIELVLWLMLIIPGLIYNLWRLSTRRMVCAECGAEQLVPPGSPVGQRIIAADTTGHGKP